MCINIEKYPRTKLHPVNVKACEMVNYVWRVRVSHHIDFKPIKRIEHEEHARKHEIDYGTNEELEPCFDFNEAINHGIATMLKTDIEKHGGLFACLHHIMSSKEINP